MNSPMQISPLSLPPLALYIHLPWCVSKCPYCDFNSHQRPEIWPEDAYVDALLADLEQDLPRVWGRPIVSIFFGGGTPSLFSARAITRLLDGVRARLRVRPHAEITLETNPGTAEFDRFEGYLAAGVNRISFGVQSFADAQLKRLGRIHDGQQAQRAYAMARAAGVSNINLDLMYALPGQDLSAALDDVKRAIDLAPEHISHYHLTMEPNTVFAAKPPADLPDEDLAWDMQEGCQGMLAEAGFEHYEVSAYARPGMRCQHNLNYWRFGDYLGIGAGAHGKLTDMDQQQIVRLAKQKHPRLYLACAGQPASLQTLDVLPARQLPFDYMLNALRLHEGFSREDFAARTGLDSAQVPALSKALADGLMEEQAQVLRPSPLGARFLNDLMARFLPD